MKRLRLGVIVAACCTVGAMLLFPSASTGQPDAAVSVGTSTRAQAKPKRPSLKLVKISAITSHVGNLREYDFTTAGFDTAVGGVVDFATLGDAYTATYRFPLPKTIPSRGAKVKFEVEVGYAPGGTVAQALSFRGDIDTVPRRWAVLQASAQNGFADETKVVTLKPRAYSKATKFVNLLVYVNYGHGPGFKYRYRVVR